MEQRKTQAGSINERNIFDYQGQGITFISQEGAIYVNATQMAQSFGKRPLKWLELESTKEFLNELENSQSPFSDFEKVQTAKSPYEKLVKVVRGGKYPGTWMHEDVALEFARWLSPKFAIWTNQYIKELLKGNTDPRIATEKEDRQHKRLMSQEAQDLAISELMLKISDHLGMVDNRRVAVVIQKDVLALYNQMKGGSYV